MGDGNGGEYVEGQQMLLILQGIAELKAMLQQGARNMATFREEVAARDADLAAQLAANAAAVQAVKDELDGTVTAQAAIQTEVDAILAAVQAGVPVDTTALQAAVAAAQASVDAVSAKVDAVAAGVADIQTQVDPTAPPA